VYAIQTTYFELDILIPITSFLHSFFMIITSIPFLLELNFFEPKPEIFSNSNIPKFKQKFIMGNLIKSFSKI